LLCTVCPSGCSDDGLSEKSKGYRDVGTATDTENGSSAQTDRPDSDIYYCRYENPFTKSAECRSYTGDGWKLAAIEADCLEPLPSAEGVLNTSPCDTEGSLGTCTTDSGGEMETITWFYDYDDPGVLKSGCEDFSHGVWQSDLEVETKTSSKLLPEALEACKSTEEVKVVPDDIDDDMLSGMRDNGGHIFFIPEAEIRPHTGLILYPGGRIDTRSFAPAAKLIARAGYFVALVPMPSYMAIGNAVLRADDVIDAHPDVERWFIAGHSIGGTGAGHYVYHTAKTLSGLIILASYMDKDHSLSDKNLPVLVQVGTQERLATEEEDVSDFEDAKAYLPADAEYFFIQGGTHFGFCYSEDPRKEISKISRETQHEIYTSKIVSFMEQ